MNIKGRFIRENYLENLKYQSFTYFQELIDQGVNLWDIPRLKEQWEKDEPDSFEESEESEDEEETTTAISNMMGELMPQFGLKVDELAEGFKALVEKEEREIASVRDRCMTKK